MRAVNTDLVSRWYKLQESTFSKRNDLKCLWYGTKRTIDITASGVLEMLILTVVSLDFTRIVRFWVNFGFLSSVFCSAINFYGLYCGQSRAESVLEMISKLLEGNF